MLSILLICLLIHWASNTVVGYRVYDTPPNEFASLDDAMDYAELRKTGWRGTPQEFYEWESEV